MKIDKFIDQECIKKNGVPFYQWAVSADRMEIIIFQRKCFEKLISKSPVELLEDDVRRKLGSKN